jgi:hypothetical protein
MIVLHGDVARFAGGNRRTQRIAASPKAIAFRRTFDQIPMPASCSIAASLHAHHANGAFEIFPTVMRGMDRVRIRVSERSDDVYDVAALSGVRVYVYDCAIRFDPHFVDGGELNAASIQHDNVLSIVMRDEHHSSPETTLPRPGRHATWM